MKGNVIRTEYRPTSGSLIVWTDGEEYPMECRPTVVSVVMEPGVEPRSKAYEILDSEGFIDETVDRVLIDETKWAEHREFGRPRGRRVVESFDELEEWEVPVVEFFAMPRVRRGVGAYTAVETLRRAGHAYPEQIVGDLATEGYVPLSLRGIDRREIAEVLHDHVSYLEDEGDEEMRERSLYVRALIESLSPDFYDEAGYPRIRSRED